MRTHVLYLALPSAIMIMDCQSGLRFLILLDQGSRFIILKPYLLYFTLLYFTLLYNYLGGAEQACHWQGSR